jgi:hypothetical protein
LENRTIGTRQGAIFLKFGSCAAVISLKGDDRIKIKSTTIELEKFMLTFAFVLAPAVLFCRRSLRHICYLLSGGNNIVRRLRDRKYFTARCLKSEEKQDPGMNIQIAGK